MVKKIDIFDDYNKNDRIVIVLDSNIHNGQESNIKEGSVFGFYTNEYDATHGAYVYLDFRGWIDSNGVFVKPSSLVVTLRNTSGAFVKGGFSKVIFDENGFAGSIIKNDYFVFNPVNNTLEFNNDTLFSKYWITNKKIDSGFFKKFNNTYGVKVEDIEDFVDDNISKTGLDVHITKTNGKLDVNYPGSHNLGSGGAGASVIDIDLPDYIIGLENDTLEDSFYNVIEREVYRTNAPNKQIYMTYQGCGGIFETNNKIHIISRDNYVTVDKATDRVTDEQIYGFLNHYPLLNRNVCELDDYYVVFVAVPSGNTPFYFLIDKATDEIRKVEYIGMIYPTQFASYPMYCKVKEYAPCRFFSDGDTVLTNGEVIWAMRTNSQATTNQFFCLTDPLNGTVYDDITSTAYCWVSGAQVDDVGGRLWIPYKNTNTSPITTFRMYKPTGNPFNTYVLPGDHSLFMYQTRGYKFGLQLVYFGYNLTPNNLSFIIVNTNTETISTIPISTVQYKSAAQDKIVGMFHDKTKNRLYISFQTATDTFTMGYLDIDTMNYIPGSLDITYTSNDFPPCFFKRNDEDSLVILYSLGLGNPSTYGVSIVSDDLTNITLNTAIASQGYYQSTLENADILNVDDNFIYVKPYNSNQLIKVAKSDGSVSTVNLRNKGSYYYNQTQESIVVLDNDNILVYPAWQIKNGEVSDVIDDKTKTETRGYHVLDSLSGLVRVESGNKVYSPIAGVKSNYNDNVDLIFERLKLGDVGKIHYIKNHEEVPFDS